MTLGLAGSGTSTSTSISFDIACCTSAQSVDPSYWNGPDGNIRYDGKGHYCDPNCQSDLYSAADVTNYTTAQIWQIQNELAALQAAQSQAKPISTTTWMIAAAIGIGLLLLARR